MDQTLQSKEWMDLGWLKIKNKTFTFTAYKRLTSDLKVQTKWENGKNYSCKYGNEKKAGQQYLYQIK